MVWLLNLGVPLAFGLMFGEYCRHDTAGRCLPPGVFPALHVFHQFPGAYLGQAQLLRRKHCPRQRRHSAADLGARVITISTMLSRPTIATACAGGNSIPAKWADCGQFLGRSGVRSQAHPEIQDSSVPDCRCSSASCRERLDNADESRADLARNPGPGIPAVQGNRLPSGKAVQAERVQAGADALRDRWRKTELRTRYKELEYRLKMQHRRLAMLQQAALSAS